MGKHVENQQMSRDTKQVGQVGGEITTGRWLEVRTESTALRNEESLHYAKPLHKNSECSRQITVCQRVNEIGSRQQMCNNLIQWLREVWSQRIQSEIDFLFSAAGILGNGKMWWEARYHLERENILWGKGGKMMVHDLKAGGRNGFRRTGREPENLGKEILFLRQWSRRCCCQ